jgi:hypothetical protein
MGVVVVLLVLEQLVAPTVISSVEVTVVLQMLVLREQLEVVVLVDESRFFKTLVSLITSAQVC